MAKTVTRRIWGKAADGKAIYRYKMTNSSGASVTVTNVGAGIVSIVVPDRNGKLGDVVIGYGKAESYFADGPCAGKCPGRYANRIAKGEFTLDGVKYTLPVNNGPNHLHGGPEGFQNQVWDSCRKNGGVEFRYRSEDMEAGYPGNLTVIARYEWSEDNELCLTFKAKTDRKTVINLTNHSYFNLNCRGNVMGQFLQLNASAYLPTDSTLIPTGKAEDVEGTPMDFRTAKRLGKDIRKDFPALNSGKGYDACWCIDGYRKGVLLKAGELFSKVSGRSVAIYTTQPGIQVYTGNYLSGCPVGKRGRRYHDYDAVALECQHFPDSPNNPSFPTTVLAPGKTFKETIKFVFGTRAAGK